MMILDEDRVLDVLALKAAGAMEMSIPADAAPMEEFIRALCTAYGLEPPMMVSLPDGAAELVRSIYSRCSEGRWAS